MLVAHRSHERIILDAVRILVREVRLSSLASQQATGLSAAQLFVLRTLAREPGLGVSALATRTLTHQSSVSVVVAKLIAAGLVGRRRSASDGRCARLHPTPAGLAIALGSADPIQERLVGALQRLSGTSRRRLAAELAHWVAELGVDASAPEMFFETASQ